MAVVEMKKLTLVGLKQDSDRIMNILTKSKSFEPEATQDYSQTVKSTDKTHFDKLISKQARLAFAIDYLVTQNKEIKKLQKKRKKFTIKDDFFNTYQPYKAAFGLKVIGMADFYDISAKEYELLSVADLIEKISFERLEIKSQVKKITAERNLLLPYIDFPYKFSITEDTKNISVIVVRTKFKKIDMSKILKDFVCEYELFSTNKRGFIAVVLCKKEDKESVTAVLGSNGFLLCPYRDNSTAKNLLEDYNNQLKQLNKYDLAKFKEALTVIKYLDDLKTLYDYFGVEIEKSQADLNCCKTDYTFVMQGWVPKEKADKILIELNNQVSVLHMSLTEPDDSDVPPTLLKNSKIITPYEDITNLYSPPDYREVDPNPVMAFFFFIIFGLMTGDVGYGLFLAAATTLFILLAKPKRGMRNLILIFGISSLSTIIWGLLFGSVFGIDLPFRWFNPIQEPIKFMALSLVLGVVQILVGYTFKFIALIKEKKFADAFLDIGLIYILFAGIIMVALDIFIGVFKTGQLNLSGGYLDAGLKKVLSKAGLICLLVSIAGIFFTAGRKSKSIGGKLGGGLNGVYGLVNLLSDILSYLRVFGIGMAGAAIAFAFNNLGQVFLNLLPVPINFIVVAIILVFFHAFNLALGLLGAYVHNIRLQYLEFYGKFYTGGGRLFRPIGDRTKYIYLN